MATPKKEPQVTSPKDQTPAVPANSDLTAQTPNPPKHQQDEMKNVAEALARKTADGKGADPVPEADFESFATEGVEKDNLLSVKDVASEVLAGRWGASFAIAEVKLEAAGYDVDEVWEECNRRKAGGAPSAF